MPRGSCGGPTRSAGSPILVGMNEQAPSGGTATSASELLAAEDAGWEELHALLDSLSPDQAEQPGYYPEGWCAKDVLAHIGAWLAEAGVILERILVGTYRPEEIDVDALNRQFLEALKDVPADIVLAQAWAARTRMQQAWGGAPRAYSGSGILGPQGRTRALR